MNVCYSIVGNREDAEDLCQEVFIKIYRSIGTFKHRSKLSTWIYRIAVNLSLNHIRKKNPGRPISHEKTELIPGLHLDRPDLSLEQKERRNVVQWAINSLPVNQRVVLKLQKFEGFSSRQIADMLDCSLFTVQSRLHRAKVNLYKKLLPYLKKI